MTSILSSEWLEWGLRWGYEGAAGLRREKKIENGLYWNAGSQLIPEMEEHGSHKEVAFATCPPSSSPGAGTVSGLLGPDWTLEDVTY